MNKRIRKVAKLENELRGYKQCQLETNEHLNNIELEEALKGDKVDTMRWDVSEMKILI